MTETEIRAELRVLELVLAGLRREEQTPQVRRIVASIKTMRGTRAAMLLSPLTWPTVVHHLDGDPKNNDSANLALLAQAAKTTELDPREGSAVTRPMEPFRLAVVLTAIEPIIPGEALTVGTEVRCTAAAGYYRDYAGHIVQLGTLDDGQRWASVEEHIA